MAIARGARGYRRWFLSNRTLGRPLWSRLVRRPTASRRPGRSQRYGRFCRRRRAVRIRRIGTASPICLRPGAVKCPPFPVEIRCRRKRPATRPARPQPLLQQLLTTNPGGRHRPPPDTNLLCTGRAGAISSHAWHVGLQFRQRGPSRPSIGPATWGMVLYIATVPDRATGRFSPTGEIAAATTCRSACRRSRFHASER